MTSGNKVKNYYKGRSFNPLRYFYIYIDTKSYMADSLIREANLKSIRFKKHFSSDRYTDFNVVFCTIKKKDKDKFIECMDKLYDKMVICGYKANYDNLCGPLISAFETRTLPTEEEDANSEEMGSNS